jgi:dinuclear metal center YbgI/SA1388 family protein
VLISDVVNVLRELAPLELAESWDNVGLLLGDAGGPVSRVMTCLTLTSDVADEAVAGQADLVVSHHPVLFRPVQRLTSETPEGRTLLKLLQHGVAVFSPHTAFDSALEGINAQLAARLGLANVRPLRPKCETPAANGGDEAATVGGGRWGRLPSPLPPREFLEHVSAALGTPHLQHAGLEEMAIESVAVACGSAAEFLVDARRTGCDVLVTGEARFHSCLEARETGVGLVLAGHYATERPAVEWLARHVQQAAPSITAWASRNERDPLEWWVG